MKLPQRILIWIENHGAAPAYAGWVLMGLTLCFWMAAANTMAGWLYVLCGVGVALLILAAILPTRSLKDLKIERSPLSPVHVGDALFVDISLRNLSPHTKGWLWVQDQIPQVLGDSPQSVVDEIGPRQTYTWHYCLEPQRRGLYQWEDLVLRTGAPLGLFWSRRVRKVYTQAVVYPRVFPLDCCPILDEVGPAARQMPIQQTASSKAGQEGLTRSLRPYRWGDPMRLVHWRSSARFDELQVRELELHHGGQTVAIAIDLGCSWHPDDFEGAVSTAASLYDYAAQYLGGGKLWTTQGEVLQERQRVLEVLAQIEPQHQGTDFLPTQAVVWLTSNADSIQALPLGSRAIVWNQTTLKEYLGVSINPNIPLQVQLQGPLQSLMG
jgi:uncharacterized protein (DUF58 family)